MSFQNLYPDDWVGKMVWIFQSDTPDCLPDNRATHGIVIAVGETRGSYIVLDTNGIRTVWDMDIELMEDWDGEVEREDGSSEE